jgi:hypothetical protein
LSHTHSHHHHHHDNEAIVVSGSIELSCSNSESLRHALELKLQDIAHNIREQNGIIGHIKALYNSTTTDMFSITDVDLAVKRSPGETVAIHLVAIVFLVDEESVTQLVNDALSALKEGV